MRGDDQFVAPTLEQVQHLAARDLDARSLRWQYFLDAIWQQPAVYRCHYAISPLVRAACQQANRQKSRYRAQQRAALIPAQPPYPTPSNCLAS